jgi:phage terminase Nu1 subunit (DNA packaging protein)
MSESQVDHEEVQEVLEVGRLARVKLYQKLVEKVTRGITLKPSELTVMRSLEEEIKKEAFGQSQAEEKPKRILPTLDQAALHYGKSTRTLRRWSHAGMPVLPGNRYDLDQIDLWLERKKGAIPADGGESLAAEREEQPGASGPAPAQPGQGKDHWDAKNKEWQAKQRELDYRKEQGELVERSKVEEVFVGRIMAVKQGLLAIPRALPPELVGKSEREMEEILRRAVTNLLEEYSRPLPASIGAAA